MSLQMCRTCLQWGSDYVSVDSGNESYRHKLLICVPEINVDIPNNPVLCDECAIKLNEAYKFWCTCIESEKKINYNVMLSVYSLESNIEFETKNIVLSEEHMNEQKKRSREDVANNQNVEIQQECFTEDVGRMLKRPRQSSENFTSVLDIKQEPESDEQVNNDVEENNNDEEKSKEFLALPLNNVTIKEEQDFFYSEYDVDSKENNKVNLSSQDILDLNIATILREHSYFKNINVGEDLIIEAVNSKKVINKNPSFMTEQFVRINMKDKLKKKSVKRKKSVKPRIPIKPVKPKENRYLSVKVNTERKFMCRFCNKIFNENALLQEHINMTHNKNFSTENAKKEVLCKICNMLFDEKIMKRHLELHSAEKIEENADSASQIKLICTVCGDSFSDEKLFTMHYQKHKQGQVITTCDVCSETYDENSVKVHLEFHNIVEEIILNGNVNESTLSSINPKVNVQFEAGTSRLQSSNYTCCNEEFSNLYLLHLHTTKVHGYVCYVCDMKFPNKQALGGHFRVHSEEKTHQCKDCHKYFVQRSNLLRHTHFVHNCIMPYKCDNCGQRFKRNKYLEEHMRTHTQRYVCTECDRVFTELKLLRRHKRYHIPRPHKCDLCDTVFTAKSSLVRHKRDIHKIKITGRRSYGLGDIVLGSTKTTQ